MPLRLNHRVVEAGPRDGDGAVEAEQQPDRYKIEGKIIGVCRRAHPLLAAGRYPYGEEEFGGGSEGENREALEGRFGHLGDHAQKISDQNLLIIFSNMSEIVYMCVKLNKYGDCVWVRVIIVMKSLELADLESCQLVPALLTQFLQFGRNALELSSFLVLGPRLDELSVRGGTHACESAFFCIDAFALSFGVVLLLFFCCFCGHLVWG
jgi:hypothetical protein